MRSRAVAFATVANALVFATGVLVLIGWFFDLTELTYLISPAANVKTNTALAFASVALANQVLMSAEGRRGWSVAGRVVAIVPLMISGLTLSEHIVGWDLGIDQALAREPAGAFATASPNRMGPPASTTLLLLSTALLLLETRRWRDRATADILVVLSCVIAVLPILGYAYGFSPLYAVARYTGIALTTAVALLLLSVAILSGRPERGIVAFLSRGDEVGALVRRLLPAALLLPFGLGWLLARAVRGGLVDGGFAISAMVVILMVGLSAVIWRTGAQLARSLDARLAAERALSASERSLREADRQKNDFLATLSHELRNPLAPIRFAVALLGGHPEMAVRARETINRQVTHLTRLIDDLLDLTRITRNKLQLRRRSIEVHAIVHDALDAVSALMASTGHQVVVHLPEQPIWLDADPDRIGQVLTNLLTNAARYSAPGSHIAVTVEREHSEAIISVRDEGVGLDAADLSRVFDMFVQVGEGSHGGLGIGLALVKGIVELHGGSVEARSDGRHRGAEFRVRLPRTTPPVRQSAGPLPAATGAPQRVLVVDDNKDAADRLADLLRQRGHHVEVCYDAEEALSRVESFAPQVGLFDVGLPGLNGYQLAERLRAGGDGRRMLLVAITGWGQEDDRRAALAAGFDAHLTKPADPDAILRLLAEKAAAGVPTP